MKKKFGRLAKIWTGILVNIKQWIDNVLISFSNQDSANHFSGTGVATWYLTVFLP
jgi:hypothetical protein